jgi:siroheme synthase
VCILMGMHDLDHIAKSLIAPADRSGTPAAVIQ